MDKSSGVLRMREYVAIIAGPRTWGDTRQSWLSRAARRAGVSYRQMKAAFYGEISETHLAARAIIAAANKRREEEAKDELAELRTRLALVESYLRQVDADFHSETIASLGVVVGGHRTLDRAGTEGE